MLSTRTIILLADENKFPELRAYLLGRNPSLAVQPARGVDDLREEVERLAGGLRLLSFLSDMIVPADVLARLEIAPYNVHPGPPEYPGAHPDSFAIWDGAQEYGVTAHEMTARVDEGPIVAVSRFAMPAAPARLALADAAFARAVNMFALIGAHCAESDDRLPPMDEAWSGVKRTKKDFRALCRSWSGTAPADRERLARACGPDLEAPAAA